MPRRPERKLEVLWQMHTPSRYPITTDEGLDENDARVDALADLAEELEAAITSDIVMTALDDGDVVVTISKRPLEH